MIHNIEINKQSIVIERIKPESKKRYFYSYMGEFFASKAIRKELGDCMSSNEDYVWWMAINKDDEVIGFCAAEIKNVIHMKHAYIQPEYRKTGLYTKLVNLRLKYLKTKKKKISVVASPDSYKILRKQKFIKTGQRGRYILMTYDYK